MITSAEVVLKGDQEWGLKNLARIEEALGALSKERLGSAKMVAYNFDTMVHLEIQVGLWKIFIMKGWDGIASHVGDVIGEAGRVHGTSHSGNLMRDEEMRATVQFWRAWRRRAMDEGVDLTLLAMTI